MSTVGGGVEGLTGPHTRTCNSRTRIASSQLHHRGTSSELHALSKLLDSVTSTFHDHFHFLPSFPISDQTNSILIPNCFQFLQISVSQPLCLSSKISSTTLSAAVTTTPSLPVHHLRSHDHGVQNGTAEKRSGSSSTRRPATAPIATHPTTTASVRALPTGQVEQCVFHLSITRAIADQTRWEKQKSLATTPAATMTTP